MNEYKGSIVEESLLDSRVLNDFEILNVVITNEERSTDRWHIYSVKCDRDAIKKLSHSLKPKRWYVNMWDEDVMIVIFPNKIFEFHHNDQESRREAIRYGVSIDIPETQLDFKKDDSF